MSNSATMTALLLTDAGPRVTNEQPVPSPRPGEALLSVRMAGICATDLAITRGYKGGFRGVMGHEFVATVAAVGAPQDEHWLGKRVAGEINISCGNCNLCRRGLAKHCRERSAPGIFGHDGVFAEYVTLPLENLHLLPDHLSDEAATFVEPLAAALEISQQVHLHAADRVYVLGDGRLGLLVAMALARIAPDTTLLGRTSDKLAIAANAGVQTLLLPNASTHAADLAQTTSALAANPADVVVEVTGSPQGFALARTLVRPAGALVLKSTFADHLADFDISALVVDEITLVGSRCGPFPPAIALLASGAIDPLPLVHAVYPVQQADIALRRAAEKGVLKVLLDMRSEGHESAD